MVQQAKVHILSTCLCECRVILIECHIIILLQLFMSSLHCTQKQNHERHSILCLFVCQYVNLLLCAAVMEYQVQINNIKTKLQDTRARKKQQEELIMKVENQALKVSFFFHRDSKTRSSCMETQTRTCI